MFDDIQIGEIVWMGGEDMFFVDFIKMVYIVCIQLLVVGFYKMLKIYWNWEIGCGWFFYYYVYGVVCVEVLVDMLIGEYVIECVDVLYDVGWLLNLVLDKGQVEGVFVQGMGWLMIEELWWDKQGWLCIYVFLIYKILLVLDCFKIFNVDLVDWLVNCENIIKWLKVVGELFFMLGISVFQVLNMVVVSFNGYCVNLCIDVFVMFECVLMVIEVL